MPLAQNKIEKSYDHISIDAEKRYNKIKTQLKKKTLSKLGIEISLSKDYLCKNYPKWCDIRSDYSKL